MKIEHVAMYVKDLERAKIFFEKYFEAVSGTQYYNPKTGFRSYFLSFSDGCRLEIMNKEEMADSDNSVARTGWVHVAFSVGSKEKVDALTAQLEADGYPVISGPRTTGDGYYESCIVDVEGNQIEITV
ncbi:MAG: VOC family protein [Clostridiales bacterium]|nr:VOC family protein [Clostridiales bacterium]